VEAEINPEPTPDERKALDEALARLLAEPAQPRSSWWREGVREALSDPSEG
jgi:hypothetical protein